MRDRSTIRSFPALLVLLASAMVHAACSDAVTGPSDLEGGPWRLQSMEIMDTGAFVPDDRSRFTIEFGADGTLGVRADCNQCGGSYTLRDGRMTVGPLACTLIACPTNRGQEFASLLQGTTSLELEEGELEIESPDGTLVLTR